MCSGSVSVHDAALVKHSAGPKLSSLPSRPGLFPPYNFVLGAQLSLV